MAQAFRKEWGTTRSGTPARSTQRSFEARPSQVTYSSVETSKISQTEGSQRANCPAKGKDREPYVGIRKVFVRRYDRTSRSCDGLNDPALMEIYAQS